MDDKVTDAREEAKSIIDSLYSAFELEMEYREVELWTPFDPRKKTEILTKNDIGNFFNRYRVASPAIDIIECLILAIRRQAQEAPKTDDLQEVIDDYRRLTRELDVALNGDGAAKQASLCDIVAQVKRERETPKVASQSAEELAYKLADHGTIHCGHEDCKACPEHLKNWIKDIEADRAAQRQAGREEIQAESILHFNNRAAHLSERYADLVEALEEILPINDGDIGKGLAPYYIHSDTIKRARKALSALGEGREG